jgi:Tol biopolymer transport system component/DNA-binding winged helix-turn-helix (wHTH) protein
MPKPIVDCDASSGKQLASQSNPGMLQHKGETLEPFDVGGWRVEPSLNRVSRGGSVRQLEHKAMAVLVCLASRAGRLVSKQELIDTVWPMDAIAENTLTHAISDIREALGDDARSPTFIETIAKRGYRLAASVQDAESGRSRAEEPEEPPQGADRVDDERQEDKGGLPWLGKHAVAWLTVAAAIIVCAVGSQVIGVFRQEALPAAQVTHRKLTFTGKAQVPALSPDGEYFAYAEEQADGLHTVFVSQIGDGARLPVWRGGQRGLLAIQWSPDSTHLMIVSEDRRTEIVSRLGGPPRRLEFYHAMAWSPDGERYAGFRMSSHSLDMVDIKTGAREELALRGDFLFVFDLVWDPGEWILLLTLDGTGAYSIWACHPQTGQQHRLVDEPSRILSPHWSPPDRAVLYLRERGQTTDLMILPWSPSAQSDRGQADVVETGSQMRSLSVSRDGKRLLCLRESYSANLWLVERKPDVTGAVVTLQLTSGTQVDRGPRFSPNGQHIAFSRDVTEGQRQIFILSIDSGIERQLTFLDGDCWGAAWSPDGNEIAFGSDAGGVPRLWRIAIEGTVPYCLESTMPGPRSCCDSLEWSPGTQILYQMPGNRNLAMVDPTTEHEERLIQDDSVGWVFHPRYSPDGSQVAVFWNHRDGRGIWVLDAETGSQRIISKVEADPVSWSPDGSAVYAYGFGRDIAGPGVEKNSLILSCFVDGSPPKSEVTCPFDEAVGLDVSPDGSRLAVVVPETISDVWITENLDLGRAGHGAASAGS